MPIAFFTPLLMSWHRNENRRHMPWKGERDPYRIWLSEIILQQTRVEQGLAYYEKFIGEFPTILDLATAPEKKVFKLWEGLGYYSRCRSLLHTAKFIADHCNGKFPDDYDSIAALKGIGPYTAAAIASFAFGLPYAVLDGNVYRVLARVFGLSTPIDSPEGKKFFSNLAQQLLDEEQPGHYNQAIMDLGATICKPKLPLCNNCPFYNHCEARLHNTIDSLPVKQKKLIRKQRFINYVIAEYRGGYYVRERKNKDIWLNLHEFIPIETAKLLGTGERELNQLLSKTFGKQSFAIASISDVQIQDLTHQRIAGRFVHVKLKSGPGGLDGFTRLPIGDLNKIAFPKFILHYLNTQSNLFERKPKRASKR